MQAILIGGEKGGTGKSTIASNLAIMATLMGHDTLLVDSDKQGSSSRLLSSRKDRDIKPSPTCIQLRGKYLHNEIESLAKKYEIIVIDAGGKDSVELRSAMVCTSVSKVYSPMKPSEFDLETLKTMDDLTYLSQSYNPNLQTYILLNEAPTHAKITLIEDAKEAIIHYENLQSCSSILSHRIAFQYAAGKALSVVEFESEVISSLPPYRAKKNVPKASLEICKLYKEIFNEDFKNSIIESYLDIPEKEEAIA